MSSEKNYTTEQLESGDRFAKLISEVPEKKKDYLLDVTDAFIAGISAGINLSDKEEPELLKRA